MKFRELPEKVNVLIARLSYNGYERVEIANWLVQTALALHEHPRVANVLHKIQTGYPTPRVRNEVLKICKERRIDFAVMIDDDVVPDVSSPGRAVGYDHIPALPGQCNFFPAALDFALEHPGPCVVGAPYCAGPPDERVLVSRFRERESDDPNAHVGGLRLESFTRDEAARLGGIGMVSSLPTGLILIDLRVLDVMGAPWFDYEYEDVHRTKLASTEDTVFSRNAFYLGVPQYCAWQSWAAHMKTKAVGPPRVFPGAAIPAQIREAIRAELREEGDAARPPDRFNAAAARMARFDDDHDPEPPLADIADPPPGLRLAGVSVFESAPDGPPARTCPDGSACPVPATCARNSICVARRPDPER